MFTLFMVDYQRSGDKNDEQYSRVGNIHNFHVWIRLKNADKKTSDNIYDGEIKVANKCCPLFVLS